MIAAISINFPLLIDQYANELEVKIIFNKNSVLEFRDRKAHHSIVLDASEFKITAKRLMS